MEVAGDDEDDGEPAPGVAAGVADDDVVEAIRGGRIELVVNGTCPPPKPPRPPPTLAVTPSPTPSVFDKLMLRPDEPALSPAPTPAFTEADTPRIAEALTSKIVLLEGPANPTPALAPTPVLIVAVARTHASKMFPPLEHVPVIGLIVAEPLMVAIEACNASLELKVLLTPPGRLSGFEIEGDVEIESGSEIEVESETVVEGGETEGSETVRLVLRAGNVEVTEDAAST